MLTRRDAIIGASVAAWSATGSSLAQTPNSSKEIHMDIDIKRVGSQPSKPGPADWFTGTVRLDPLFQAPDPARVGGALVTFEPGARTAWHTHPLGQTLIITAGLGWIQREGGPIEEVRPGDVVWFPPGLKHWHGASPEVAMSHIAIQESKDGKAVDWIEKSATRSTANEQRAKPGSGNPAALIRAFPDCFVVEPVPGRRNAPIRIPLAIGDL